MGAIRVGGAARLTRGPKYNPLVRKWGTICIRLFLLATIAVGQCAALFWLYRILWLDNLRFFLPPIAAFWLFLMALRMRWPLPPRFSRLASLWLAIPLTAVSWYVGFYISVNTFGT
jgi:hypothetical protein